MSNLTPAGWYQDPGNSAYLRYWNGATWSNEARSKTPLPIVRQPGEKSVATGVVLTVLFGPFAFFYIRAVYGFIALGYAVITILLATITFGIAFIPYWIFLIIWMVRLVKAHNEELVGTNTQAFPSVSAAGVYDQGALSTQSMQAIAASTTVSATWVIHIVGSVQSPGVYQLPAGSRVHDAIERAGGLTPHANPGSINIARILIDGEQIVVP